MAETCCQCHKIRGKKAKPWRICGRCGGTVCLSCCPSHRTEVRCNSCWNKDYDEQEAARMATLIECQSCYNRINILRWKRR